MALKRSDNWPLKLRCYLDAQREAKFEFGVNDCTVHATEWIRLATSADVYAEFRGKYTSPETAAALIQTLSGTGSALEDAADYITAKFGMEEISPLTATRGDVVLFEGTDGQMLGVVHLHPMYSAFLAERGLMFLKTSACKRAWRV